MPNNMKKAGIKYQNGGTGMNGPIPTRKKNPGMPKPQNYIGNPLGYFNDKAQYGVEMKATDGGLKIYTIGSFGTLKEAEALQREVSNLGVKNPEITAKFNNQTIDIEAAKEKENQIQGTETE